MKVVILHGVGFFEDKAPNRLLINEIEKIPDCETVWYNWKHKLDIPTTTLPYKNIREWICEVILDFQTVVKYAFDMDIPKADFYVGHSAGSILALVQNRPSIIFGSPAILIDSIQGVNAVDCMLNSQPVLNIVHKKDVLAYPIPLPYFNNVYVNSPWWDTSSWNPITAHSSYWDEKPIVKLIVNQLKEWQQNPPE